MEIGYHLSSEEHSGPRLVELATQAEKVGFGFATISDHFHPWTDRQGESPFVWGVLGAIACATERLGVLTAVTCPTFRMHPAVVAHAAATAATLMPGRFELGLGSGENLNEHVIGTRWPAPRERLDRLVEAIEAIRKLFTGDQVAHRGEYYEVEDARLYSIPDTPPPIAMAAAGPVAARVAGEHADSLIVDSPDREVIERFQEAHDGSAEITGKLMMCLDDDRESARKTALEWWPIAAIGSAGGDLRLPADFESVASNTDRNAALRPILTTGDPAEVMDAAEAFADAGVTRLAIHQLGDDQERLFEVADRLLTA